MNTHTYRDRLLETENLTADLEDAEADWLLQWGIVQIDIVTEGFAFGMADETAADEKVNALMALMRRLSRLVARKDHRTPDELVEALGDLGTVYAKAFGQSRPLSPLECEHCAAQLKSLSALEALQFLVKWFAP